MYWLSPPSWWRRAAAVVLVVSAVLWDLRGADTAPYPVASASIRAGTPITDDLVTWVHLPDVFPPSDPTEGVAAVDIAVGDPLSGSVVAGPARAPEGWWTIPIVVGTLARPGDEALLVVADPPLSVIGLVVASQEGDPFDLDHRPASVAVPPEAAPLVAAADRQGLLVTAIRTSTAGQ